MKGVRVYNSISADDLSHIYQLYKEGRWEELELLGSGAVSRVFGYKDYAIKVAKKKELWDIPILKSLQGMPCIPILYATIDKKVIIMERVRGVTVYDYIYQNERGMKKVDQFIHPDFNEIYKEGLTDIIKAGYSPKDLHEANVMINQTGRPVIIDVGSFEKLDGDFSLEDDIDALWSLEVICGGINTYLSRKLKRKKTKLAG